MATQLERIQIGVDKLLSKANYEFLVDDPESEVVEIGLIDPEDTYSIKDADAFFRLLSDLTGSSGEMKTEHFLNFGEANPEALDTVGRGLAILGLKGSDTAKTRTLYEAKKEFGYRVEAAGYLTGMMVDEGLIEGEAGETLRFMFSAVLQVTADSSGRVLESFISEYQMSQEEQEGINSEIERLGRGKEEPRRQPSGGGMGQEQLQEIIKEWFEENRIKSSDFTSYPTLTSAARSLAEEIIRSQ